MESVLLNDKTYIVEDKKLILKYKGINDISEIKGLENLTDLRELDLSYNNITELKGLDALQNLISLNLSNNRIREIKGLKNLKILRFLRLSNNNINEIKGLDSLKYLLTLFLDGNQIEEIKGLNNLKNLNAIYLRGNNITEVKGVEDLKNLKLVDLSEISHISHKVSEDIRRKGLMVRKQSDTLYKYRYLIFLSLFIIVSAILPFFFIEAISLNIGKDYWKVFRGIYLLTFFLVLLGSAAILFAVAVIGGPGVFEGRGALLALVIAYIVMVAILGPAIYYGLLNFKGL